MAQRRAPGVEPGPVADSLEAPQDVVPRQVSGAVALPTRHHHVHLHHHHHHHHHHLHSAHDHPDSDSGGSNSSSGHSHSHHNSKQLLYQVDGSTVLQEGQGSSGSSSSSSGGGGGGVGCSSSSGGVGGSSSSCKVGGSSSSGGVGRSSCSTSNSGGGSSSAHGHHHHHHNHHHHPHHPHPTPPNNHHHHHHHHHGWPLAHVIDVPVTPTSSSSSQDPPPPRQQHGHHHRHHHHHHHGGHHHHHNVHANAADEASSRSATTRPRRQISLLAGDRWYAAEATTWRSQANQLNPLTSPLWMAVELTCLLLQVLIGCVGLWLASSERPRDPLRLWLAGYMAGCVALIHLLHRRWRRRCHIPCGHRPGADSGHRQGLASGSEHPAAVGLAAASPSSVGAGFRQRRQSGTVAWSRSADHPVAGAALEAELQPMRHSSRIGPPALEIAVGDSAATTTTTTGGGCAGLDSPSASESVSARDSPRSNRKDAASPSETGGDEDEDQVRLLPSVSSEPWGRTGGRNVDDEGEAGDRVLLPGERVEDDDSGVREAAGGGGGGHRHRSTDGEEEEEEERVVPAARWPPLHASHGSSSTDDGSTAAAAATAAAEAAAAAAAAEERCKQAADALFAAWLVVGNLWLFGGTTSFADSPVLFSLCLLFIVISTLSYAAPFLLCTTFFCCLPCISAIMGFDDDIGVGGNGYGDGGNASTAGGRRGVAKGATAEAISALPTFRFKIQRPARKGKGGEEEVGRWAGEVPSSADSSEEEWRLGATSSPYSTAMVGGCGDSGDEVPLLQQQQQQQQQQLLRGGLASHHNPKTLRGSRGDDCGRNFPLARLRDAGEGGPLVPPEKSRVQPLSSAWEQMAGAQNCIDSVHRGEPDEDDGATVREGVDSMGCSPVAVGLLWAGTAREQQVAADDAVCPICLAHYCDGAELRQLPCGHCFHVACVDTWLPISACCPLCKLDIAAVATRTAAEDVVLAATTELAMEPTAAAVSGAEPETTAPTAAEAIAAAAIAAATASASGGLPRGGGVP